MSGKNLLNMRRGGALVMTALSAIFMLGMTALVTDVGFLYYSQSRLQTAVNAGWKAGYDRMLETVKGRYIPLAGSAQDINIRAHISEVMQQNGINTADLKSLVISYTPVVARPYPGYYLRVEATQNVGLFFAKIMNFATSDVYASRENHANDLGQGVVPLAIPHGEVGDLSRSTYSYREFVDGEGFAGGNEYVLKLGSGNTRYVPTAPTREEVFLDYPEEAPAANEPYMIYIPMGPRAQSPEGFLKAYGLVYSTLGTLDGQKGITPVYWLLGTDGGAFLVPYSARLKADPRLALVSWNPVNSEKDAQKIFDDAYRTGTFYELYYQKKVAVYSNNAAKDITALTLDTAGIPYSRINDDNVLSGALSGVHLLCMASEDLTGYSGGCSQFDLTCQDFFKRGAFGPVVTVDERIAAARDMCLSCQSNYNPNTNIFLLAAATACEVKQSRCSERKYDTKDAGGNPKTITYGELDAGILKHPQLICGTSTASLCAGFIKNSAELGDFAPFTNDPHRIQLKKWEIVSRIRDHVATGGYVFAHGFSGETLELALYQKSVKDGVPYDYNMAFDSMTLKDFPARRTPVYYSDINSIANPAIMTFDLYVPKLAGEIDDPRCQSHILSRLELGLAETHVFRPAVMASHSLIIGYQYSKTDAKYIKGPYHAGEYCYLAGNINSPIADHKVAAQRLILDNVLYADSSEKAATGYVTPPVVSRQKSNYGPIDPDNYVGGGASDYNEWFSTGFDQPLQLWDHVISESGNMRGPTDDAVEFRMEGDAETPPSTRIIIPITGVPPYIQNMTGADTIYSLQGNDNPNGLYTPDLASFSSAVYVIGFAEFELIDPKDFDESGSLGAYQPGQVRGKFIRYVIDPREVAAMDPYVTGEWDQYLPQP